MANLNKVFLMGNLTRDPDLRYSPSGTAVASFGMAIGRTYTASSGEKKEETCFVRIVVFGRQAETCSQYLSKGRLALIEGRLQYRTWETEGQKRSSLDVVADRVQFLGPRKEGGFPSEATLEEESVAQTPAEEKSPSPAENQVSDKSSEEEIPF